MGHPVRAGGSQKGFTEGVGRGTTVRRAREEDGRGEKAQAAPRVRARKVTLEGERRSRVNWSAVRLGSGAGVGRDWEHREMTV